MNKKIIIANWKMNPSSLKEAARLLDQIMAGLKSVDFSALELVFAPPFLYIHELKKRLSREAGLAAQNVSFAERGAYTGEISALMLKNMNCGHIIIGHSERRWELGETGKIINQKIKQAITVGLSPVLAVGEKEPEDNSVAVLNSQLQEALDGINPGLLGKLIIAYEPVWAIGTGVSDTPNGALSASILIRKIIRDLCGAELSESLPVLYGGSINAENAAGLIKQKGIDGALIGGASLDAQEFIKIIKSMID